LSSLRGNPFEKVAVQASKKRISVEEKDPRVCRKLFDAISDGDFEAVKQVLKTDTADVNAVNEVSSSSSWLTKTLMCTSLIPRLETLPFMWLQGLENQGLFDIFYCMELTLKQRMLYGCQFF
jgi:hypothetical protein